MIKFNNVKILLYSLSLILLFLSGPSLSSAADKSISIVKSGSGLGSVKVSKEGINNFRCNFYKYKNSSQCKRNYTKNDQVKLTATPYAGSTFSGWGGGACSGIYPCTINLYENKEVIAYFNEGSSSSSSSSGGGNPILKLQKGGSSGGGKVTRDSVPTYCPMYAENASCSYNFYPINTVVKLTADPDGGNSFVWSGDDCSGSSLVCNITLNSDKTVVADFIPSGEEGPVIDSFTTASSIVKTGSTAILSGEATNISACNLISREDSSLGNYGTPPVMTDSLYVLYWNDYYWRNVGADFTWTTQSLSIDGKTYSYKLLCRGNGAYDNSIISNGIQQKDISLYTVYNVGLNVTKSGYGNGNVTSDNHSFFGWKKGGQYHTSGVRHYMDGVKPLLKKCPVYKQNYYCNSLTVGQKLYDGRDAGPTVHSDITGNIYPIYNGIGTSRAVEYVADSASGTCPLSFQYGGTLDELTCSSMYSYIDCGSVCSATYEYGDNTKITLTATPKPTSSGIDSVFNSWGGVTCEEGTNSGNTCTITMSGHQGKNIDANFIVDPSNTFFEYTGSSQIYTVPIGVSKLKIIAYGAKGGGSSGGKGGMAQGTITVSPGDKFYVYVGGRDIYGFGGGGQSGSDGHGGGASDVRKDANNDGSYTLSERIIVAGGGGGGGTSPTKVGGVGGGLTGGVGTGIYPGQGGGQTSGGSGGGGDRPGSSGMLGVGGSTHDHISSQIGLAATGGGGGGYYGGGAAGDSDAEGDQSGGGGGGSSYIAGLSDSSTQSGVREGNGQVIIQAIK